MFIILRKLTSVAIATGLMLTSSSALASDPEEFAVTITNITNSINFTPILVASHRKGLSPLFELGSAANADIEAVAEGGNIGPLTATLEANDDVVDVDNSVGLLIPGASVTVMVSAKKGAKRISIISMMLPTNDGFIALNGVKTPKKGTATYYSPGYDAGTEFNDELCANIPGPTCGGPGDPSDEALNDEGYVHIHRGIHGVGDLAIQSAVQDWRNPVAKITITRIDDDDDDDDDDD